MNKYIKLPCDVGETIYVIRTDRDTPYIQEEKILAFEICNIKGEHKLFIKVQYFGVYEYNTNICLDMKEANAKLKELNKKLEREKKIRGEIRKEIEGC